MDLGATIFSTGWASGVNSYATVLVLALLARAGVGDVPAGFDADWVLYVSGAMFAVEFVTDKVPFLDSAWDTVHTVVRPLIGAVIGFSFAGESGIDGIGEALGGGVAGITALASHCVKAGLRLGVNTSPEPASNILVSLAEDATVAAVAVLAIEHPELAALVAAVCLAAGALLLLLLWRKVVRPGWARLRAHYRAGVRDP
ncbi:MAG: DUF4126 domain-containing protein [Acidobacteria bacterium]|nr:MAG: DUF4126 domain-containing protein [Acidobacteriota bacterium]GIK76835.1 MAG: membrane protein [Actinomycetes bacterium]